MTRRSAYSGPLQAFAYFLLMNCIEQEVWSRAAISESFKREAKLRIMLAGAS